MTTRLIIIADDLTGALDAAAPFCCKGNKVVVAVSITSFANALATRADIVAVSTRSREIAPQKAFERVRRVVDQISDIPIFKKVDSRLKGNLISELDAFSGMPLIIAPALPTFDRVVVGGRVSGFGINNPIDVRKALGPHGKRAIVPDTTSEEDMDKVVRLYDGELLVGARSLSAAIARKFKCRTIKPSPLAGRTAVAIGSNDPITLGQVDALDRNLIEILKAPSGSFDGQFNDPKDKVLLQAVSGPILSREAVSQNLAKSFKPFANKANNLVLSGGATAEALLDALDVSVLELEGELLPGIPVSRSAGWRVVTKSGGFGQPDALAKLLHQ